MAMGPLTRYPAENERMSATTMRLGSAEEEPVTCGESWERDGDGDGDGTGGAPHELTLAGEQRPRGPWP